MTFPGLIHDFAVVTSAVVGVGSLAWGKPGAWAWLHVCGMIELLCGLGGIVGLGMREGLSVLSHENLFTWAFLVPHVEVLTFGSALIGLSFDPDFIHRRRARRVR
ncbi:MAG: hypothetical protein KDC95_23220 [Planctomycetes bacterium]|nr:hypothetical protein [Planctomycetota bacterium]